MIQPAAAATAALAVDAAHAVPPDLTLEVIDQARDDRNFVCTVTSPWLDDFRDKQPESWVLDRRAGDLVNAHMKEFTAADVKPESRLLSLNGSGVVLWDEAAPPRFKEAYGQLVAQGRPPQTIQVISQEPHIPWELLIPTQPGEDDQRPLGVRSAIARWFDVAPMRAAGTPVGDARVVAPTHDAPPKPLPLAEDEARFVCGRMGQRIKPATPSDIETCLKAWSGTVLHFVCHGKDGTTQAVLLDGTERLTSTQVAGMFALRTAWARTAPIVFLNACDVGRAAPVLNGAGGLVQAWVKAGAGAVIAPLWSVRDKIAHKVALAFYERVIAEPLTPYADIVRDIRALAYENGEDTYAAYCYFGSPRSSAKEAGL
jgi:hypothetical protein